MNFDKQRFDGKKIIRPIRGSNHKEVIQTRLAKEITLRIGAISKETGLN